MAKSESRKETARVACLGEPPANPSEICLLSSSPRSRAHKALCARTMPARLRILPSTTTLAFPLVVLHLYENNS